MAFIVGALFISMIIIILSRKVTFFVHSGRPRQEEIPPCVIIACLNFIFNILGVQSSHTIQILNVRWGADYHNIRTRK